MGVNRRATPSRKRMASGRARNAIANISSAASRAASKRDDSRVDNAVSYTSTLNSKFRRSDLVKIFWTPQLSNFSHLSHFRLILIRAFVPQVRMQTAAVVKHGDVIQYILLGFMAGLVTPPLNPLLLHAAEEAFYDSIVPAVTLPAHAAFNAVCFQ